MYDENYCLNDFKEFYINDESKYDEFLLNLHSNYILKLRNEIDEIKPLLKLISNLNELKSDKILLDLSIKDPSRLLKRNSFKILKNEEKLRNKLNKLLPLTINELKLKIKEFELKYNRFFIINNENYSITLNNLEIELLGNHHNQNKKFKSIRGRSIEKSSQISRERSRSRSLPRKEILASSTRQNRQQQQHQQPPRSISRSNSRTLSRSNSNLSSKNRSVSRKSINDPFNSKEIKDISPTKYINNHSSSSDSSSSSSSSSINQQPRKISGSVLLSANAHKINLEKLNTNDSLLLLSSSSTSSSTVKNKDIIIPEIPIISSFNIHQDTNNNNNNDNNNIDKNYLKPLSPSKLPIYKSSISTNNIITNTRSYLNRIPTSPVKFKDTVKHSNNDQVPEPISSDFECDDDNDENTEKLTLKDNKENYQPILNKSLELDNSINPDNNLQNNLQNNSNIEINTN
ncbi:unnamed protein product [[Candida] boidinii]|uniref:Unnamed protein product n=1 Tax=Candida boidinii TaxID=5477 RepID=A0ACB5TUQ9_CANBO|nr:unnamed protein product [[Candida] boidinii]